ncbi:hypothetical protein DOY81_005274 [Sarcophaga bullata]|nr:hypothetical protein DOY81_005274 [Sarcophaga bullata]
MEQQVKSNNRQFADCTSYCLLMTSQNREILQKQASKKEDVTNNGAMPEGSSSSSAKYISGTYLKRNSC